MPVPVYSHESYDVCPSHRELVDATVVIMEGVNALQFPDHLDVGVYVDAPEAAIEHWYADRLVGMFAAAPPGSFYAELGFDEAQQRAFADQVWSGINHLNLVEHILRPAIAPRSWSRRDPTTRCGACASRPPRERVTR